MSDEPLYCRACGAEDWDCGCIDAVGPFCEICGVSGCDDQGCIDVGGGSDPEPVDG